MRTLSKIESPDKLSVLVAVTPLSNLSCMNRPNTLLFFALSVSPRNRPSVESVERGGPVNWSARSLDFKPLDFWFWRHLKTLVHSRQMSELKEENPSHEIWVKPESFARAGVSVPRRVDSCVTAGGSPMSEQALLLRLTLTRLFFAYLSAVKLCAGGRGTALQAGRSRGRFPWGSLRFFIHLILVAAIWHWGRFTF